MTAVASLGTWAPLSRHAKLRKFVMVRLGSLQALARWSKDDAAWLDAATSQPLAFIPVEYLRT